jgi:DNA-binding transcriptional ArsR family regulator
VFFALGDGTRLAMVQRLGRGEALSATTLAGGAEVTRQAIAKHLHVLERSGLVSKEKRGREVVYSLEAHGLDEARAFIDGISAGWDRAIDRLKRMVEEPTPYNRETHRAQRKTRRP